MQDSRSIEASDVTGIATHFQRQFQELTASLSQNMGRLLWNLLVVAVILLIARLLLGLVSKFTGHVIAKRQDARLLQEDQQFKRVNTMMTLLRSTARYLIYFVAALMILDQFNLGKTVENLLVTAGIGGLAIGFGAQSLVKDVVTGFFFMFENQFSVGDYVKIGDVEGIVTATALRATYLKNEKGQQIIIPNGSISRIINYSRLGFSAADITVTVSSAADIRQTIALLQAAADNYAAEHPEAVLPDEHPQVRGITETTNLIVKISIYCRTLPLMHWETERGLRLAAKEALDAAGIK